MESIEGDGCFFGSDKYPMAATAGAAAWDGGSTGIEGRRRWFFEVEEEDNKAAAVVDVIDDGGTGAGPVVGEDFELMAIVFEAKSGLLLELVAEAVVAVEVVAEVKLYPPPLPEEIAEIPPRTFSLLCTVDDGDR